MLDYKYADLFYEDSIGKQLKIEAEDGTVITNEDIYLEEVTLQESICSDDSLTFGSCEASKFEIKIANRFSPLIDQWITVSEVLDGHEDDPFTFGKYKVQSDRPTADRIYREIVAYDAMYDIINADKGEVADWYNEILPEDYSTVTLKTFRTSFLNHFGIEEESISLPNDSMIVEKTISASELSGKAVINAICEINGCFGHIGRDGKFQYIFLNTIVSSEETSILGEMILGTAKLGGTEVSQELDASKYRASDYEDYECQTIDKVLIQETEDDAGGWAGDGDNCYTITDNFLVYGKDLEEIQSIAQTILSTISGLVYRPAEVTATGNPCIIVGDSISLDTKYQHIETYVLERTLKGIQALVDTYVAEGTEIYTNTGNSLESAIDQLKGKSNTLTRDLESTKSTIKDVEQGLSNEITQTADSLTIEIKNIKDSVDELDKTAITGSTIEYYQSDSPTELTGGEWSEDEPTWTEGTYIWVRTTIRTGDGTQTITEPVCITGNTGAAGEDGTPGPAGEDGRTSYFHVKYSPVADPTAEDMTETPSEYIGTYVDFTEADSTDPADYEWVKWLGEDGAQGIPGTNGQDGKTYYLHIAYANSEDGTVDFSTTDSEDKSYIGQYVDTEPDDSTNPSDYAWTKIKGEDGIGVESIVAYFAKSGSPDYYPTLGGDTVSILGTMILGTAVLGNTGTWELTPPELDDDDYLWLRFLVTYTDGSYAWTEPCCLTDKSVKKQIEVLDEKYNNIEITVDGLSSSVTNLQGVVTNNYSYMETRFSTFEQTVDSISAEVSKTTETVGELSTEAITGTVIEYYLSTSPTELDGGNWSEDAPEWKDGYYVWTRTVVTTGVGDTEVVSTTDPVCITGNTGADGQDGTNGIGVESITAYYATSESDSYYPTHGDDGTTSVLGTMVLGTALLGNSGTWETQMPSVSDTEYLWVCYLVEYSDGHTEWTVPYCMTDASVRNQLSTVTEEMSSVIQLVDSITQTVSSLQTTTYEEYQELTEKYSEIVQTTESISSTVSETSERVDTLTGETETIKTNVSTLEQTAQGLTTSVTNLEGEYSKIEQTVNSISLEVTGSLGQTAGITLTVGDKSETENLDLTNVRESFADEDSEISISAGTITFNSGTLIIISKALNLDEKGNLTINTNQFSLTEDGDATFSGNLNSPLGNIAGWTIGSSALYMNLESADDIYRYVNGAYIGIDGMAISTIYASNMRDAISLTTDSFTYHSSANSTNDNDAVLRIFGSQSLIYIDLYFSEDFGQGVADYSEYGRTTIRTDCIRLYDKYGDIWLETSNSNTVLTLYEGHLSINDGYIYINGSFITGSDESLKTEIVTLSSTNQDYDKVLDTLEPITFEYKADKDKKKHIGFTYQNAVDALEAGGIDPNESALAQLVEDPKTGETIGGIEYSDIIALLVYEVKQLKSEIDEMKAS